MIIDILLNILFLFINTITNLFRVFGTVGLNNDFSNGIAAFSSYITPLAAVLPISTIFAIILFEVAFESLYFLYKLIKWGYSKVPGVN
jgi:hypothetical protein